VEDGRVSGRFVVNISLGFDRASRSPFAQPEHGPGNHDCCYCQVGAAQQKQDTFVTISEEV
jgi:hypothetical protein